MSSSKIVVTPAPEPILNVSSTTTTPVPAVFKVKSPSDGAVNVEPVADKSPKLDDDQPPVLTAVPPGVVPSPIFNVPSDTSTQR